MMGLDLLWLFPSVSYQNRIAIRISKASVINATLQIWGCQGIYLSLLKSLISFSFLIEQSLKKFIPFSLSRVPEKIYH